MRFVNLTESEYNTLEEACKNHSKSQVSERAKALLLSDNGSKVNHIASIFKVRTRTIYTLMNRWKKMGIVGIMDMPRQSRPARLSITDSNVVEAVKKCNNLCQKPKQNGYKSILRAEFVYK